VALVADGIFWDTALKRVMMDGTVGAVLADVAAHVEAELRLGTEVARVVELGLTLLPVTHTVWTEERIPAAVCALRGMKARAVKVTI